MGEMEVAEGYRELGDGYVAVGRAADAETWYRRALAARPELAQAHVGLASALVGLGRRDEAEAHLRHALALDDACHGATRALAELLADDGRLAEAASAYRTLLDNGAQAEEHLRYADLALVLGAADDAERHYRRALASPEAPAEASANLGALLASRGRLEEGEALLRTAAEALGTADVLSNHANALVELGRLEEAEDGYRGALAVDPDCAEAQWGLAELYELRGEHERARVARGRAIRLRPSLAQRCR